MWLVVSMVFVCMLKIFVKFLKEGISFAFLILTPYPRMVDRVWIFLFRSLQFYFIGSCGFFCTVLDSFEICFEIRGYDTSSSIFHI